MKAPQRRTLARFLIILALAYVGLTTYLVANGHYTAAIGTGLTAVVGLLVARAIRSMDRGGPSVLLASAFAAAIIGVNIVVWSAVL